MSFNAVESAFEAADNFAKNCGGKTLLVDFDGTKTLTNLISYRISSIKTPEALSNPSLVNSNLMNYKSTKIFKNLELYIASGVKIDFKDYELEYLLRSNLQYWKTEFESVYIYVPYNYVYYDDFWKLLKKSAEIIQVYESSSRLPPEVAKNLTTIQIEK
jgi:hypothetical protein